MDTADVMAGERVLKGMRATVVSINGITRTAVIKIECDATTLQTTVEVERAIIVRDLRHGSHVKVVNGPYMGRTGFIVHSYAPDVAVIITDGFNTEIKTNISNLQKSTDQNIIGYQTLGSYALYDLVALNGNEYAVVTMVGTEMLRIINHMGQVRDVYGYIFLYITTSPLLTPTPPPTLYGRSETWCPANSYVKKTPLAGAVSASMHNCARSRWATPSWSLRGFTPTGEAPSSG